MTTCLLTSADGSGRSNCNTLGERRAKSNNFGGCSKTQLDLCFCRSRKRDRAGSQARIDSCSWQGRRSSCRNQNSLCCGGYRCEDGSCGIDRHISSNGKHWRVRSTTLQGCSSLSSRLSAPLLSSFDASTSPFVVDCTIRLAHKAMYLWDSGGSHQCCRMETCR
jgi:hypothetical protein